MVVRTIEAQNIREAFKRVKEEMGRDAYILEVRSVEKKEGVLGLRRRMQVQVTVGDRSAAATHRKAAAAPAKKTGAALLEKLYQPDTGKKEHSPPASTAADKREIVEIREMVRELLSRSADKTFETISGPCRDYYNELLENDVPVKLARGLIDKVHAGLPADRRDDAVFTGKRIRAYLRKLIRPHGPLRLYDDRPAVVELTGPTGVGKTTTIAKLAAIYKLYRNKNVGLITTDIYRIAAVSQLKTYAEIMKLPLQVVHSAAEMEAAKEKLSDKDLVLIDTAGRCQKDEKKMNELREMTAAARPDEVHLVLSAVTGERVLKNVISRFSEVSPDSIILSKIDEAVTCGRVLSIIAQVRKPVSYMTTGQEVPADIEIVQPSAIARMILSP